LVGKKVAGDLYLHKNYLFLLGEDYRSLVNEMENEINSLKEDWNLIKINIHKRRISLLYYPTFDIDAHPILKRSTSINLSSHQPVIKLIKGGNRILHRKELFVDCDYPQFEKFLKLTKEEEKLGLLDTQVLFQGKKLGTIMGNKRIWEEWLKHNNVRIEDHSVVQLDKGK